MREILNTCHPYYFKYLIPINIEKKIANSENKKRINDRASQLS